MTDISQWERADTAEMPVVQRRNQHGIVVAQIGHKAGVGYLRRNYSSHGPRWLRCQPGAPAPELRALLAAEIGGAS